MWCVYIPLSKMLDERYKRLWDSSYICKNKWGIIKPTTKTRLESHSIHTLVLYSKIKLYSYASNSLKQITLQPLFTLIIQVPVCSYKIKVQINLGIPALRRAECTNAISFWYSFVSKHERKVKNVKLHA